MKKFTLILASLMTFVGTTFAANISGLTEINNESVYTINSRDRGYLYYDAANENYITSSSHTEITDDEPTGDATQQFAILRTEDTAEGKYYIYSVAAAKFLTYSGSGVALSLTENASYTWDLIESSGEHSGFILIKVPGTEKTYINVTNWSASNGIRVAHCDNPDGGNLMEIAKVETEVDLSDALAKINAVENPEPIFEENKAYLLKHNFSELYFNMEIDGIGDGSGRHCASLQAEADASVVYFVQNPDTKNQWQIRVGSPTGQNLSSDTSWHSIINSSDGYYWTVTEFSTENSENTVVFTRTGTSVTSANVLGPNVQTSYEAGTPLYSNQDGSNSGKLDVCKFVAIEAPKTEALAAAISSAELLLTYFKDDTPGYYPIAGDSYQTLSTAISSAKEVLDSEGQTAETVDAAIADLEAAMNIEATPALTGPFNGIYTISNKDGNNSRGYLCFVESIEEGYVWASTKVKTGEGNTGTDVTIPAIDSDNAKWAFVDINGEMLLFNVANKSFIRPTGTAANTGWTFYRDKAAPITLTTSVSGIGTVEISSNLDNVDYKMSISTHYATPVGGYYAANDGGVPFVFSRVGELTEELRTEMASMNPTTGIEEVTVDAYAGKTVIYDLQGRRLSAPVKGINIINGKKVLVK